MQEASAPPAKDRSALHGRASAVLLALALVAAAAGAAILLRFAMPQAHMAVLGHAEDFPLRTEPYPFAAGNEHGFISHTAEGWVAFDAVTPHLTRCRVAWVQQDGRLEDPCSGSRFDATGRYTFGPAYRRLDRYALEVTRDGRVIVDRSRELPVTRAEWIADCVASQERVEPFATAGERAKREQACAQSLDAYPDYLTQY